MKRIKVNKNRNYTTINNEFLRNKNLSFKAKGVLAFIMSLPDDWDLSISGIEAISMEGKSAVRSSINELMNNGYVERHIVHDGKLRGYEYSVYEIPEFKQSCGFQTTEKQSCGFQTTEKQTSENHTQISKDLNKERNNKVKKEISKERKSCQKQVLTSKKDSDGELYGCFKKIFLDFYKEQKGLDYYYTGADAGSLSQLLQKISFLQEGASDTMKVRIFEHLLNSLKKNDEWVFNHLSIRLLNSQFNEIVGKIKNSKTANYDSFEAEQLKIING